MKAGLPLKAKAPNRQSRQLLLFMIRMTPGQKTSPTMLSILKCFSGKCHLLKFITSRAGSASVSLHRARQPTRPLKERIMTQMSQVAPLRSPQRKQKQLLQRKYMIALEMKHTPSSKMMMHSVYVATTVLSTSH